MSKLLLRTLVLALVLTGLPAFTVVQGELVPEVVDGTVGFSIATTSTVADGDSDEVHRSATVAAPLPFSMIGFELPDGVDTLRVRTATDDGTWGEWYELDRISADDGPDAGSAEAASADTHRFTEPAYTGEATRFQVEVPADEVAAATSAAGELDLEATVLDTEGLSGGPAERSVQIGGAIAEASTRLSVVSRASWGAQAPRSGATYASGGRIDLVVVHHTAGSNDYTPAQSAGRVRGYQAYHRNTLGWKDIGYNALIDKYGTIYEGREGGLDRAVVGAHASGYNTGSFGVSVMGNYTNIDASSAAYESLANVIAWKARIHGFDPLGTTSRTYNGGLVRTVTGHRDVGSTACPGRISDRMWWIRTQGAERRSTVGAPTLPTPSPSPEPSPSPSPSPSPEPSPSPSPEPSPSPTPVAPTETYRFTDVAADSPHRARILELDAANIINGYADNTYRPGNSLSRAQMATIFARAMNLPPVQPNGRFKDVTINTSHAGHIMALVEAGVVNGFADGTYRPNQMVTREQMATYLVNAKKASQWGNNPYVDVPVNSTHYRSIGTAHSLGYVFGFAGDRYLPQRELRRDEAANMVARAFPQP